MLASTPWRSIDHCGHAARATGGVGQGVEVGWSSEYEIRCQADCVGLRKYVRAEYFNRVSYV